MDDFTVMGPKRKTIGILPIIGLVFVIVLGGSMVYKAIKTIPGDLIPLLDKDWGVTVDSGHVGMIIQKKTASRREAVMASKEIRPEAVRDYIGNHGDKCPFCGSENIEVEDDFREYDIEDGLKAERVIWCVTCKESWTEVFVLTDISG